MSSGTSSARRWALWLVGALGASSAFGCSSLDDESREPAGNHVGGSAGSATEAAPDELEFEAHAMTVAPGETRLVIVRAVPGGSYRVRFALLGDSGDASLDRSEIVSEPDGEAAVQLTAPSAPTDSAFRIRASVGQAVATEAAINVNSNGTASVEANPKYSGQRAITFWVASARPGTSCAELTGTPPPDGQLSAESSSSYTPRLEVPAGRDLALTLRSEMKVAGCIDVPPLAVNEARVVDVPVSDVPTRLDSTPLDVTLDLGQPVPTWSNLAAPGLDVLIAATIGDSQNDVDLLLDEMTTAAAELGLEVDLDSARAAGGWDGALVSQLGDTTSDGAIRDRLRNWYELGVARLGQGAPLEARLEPVPEGPGKAWLLPRRFAGVDAAAMGFPAQVLVTWHAEPSDTVLLGASFEWLPWVTFARLAELEAAADASLPVDLPTRLAANLDCEAIGSNLHERALGQMDTCDPACLANVCAAALQNIWQRGHDAVVTEAAQLDLSATATVTVDAKARPTAFAGHWVGTLDIGELQAEASGDATGVLPEASDSSGPQ